MFVRGTALGGLLVAIEEEFGTEGMARLRAALPAAARAKLAEPITADTVYTVEVFAAFHEAIRTELGNGDIAVNRRLGARAAQVDFGTIHRAFIRVADYATLLRATERAWPRYNSHGRVEWPYIGKGQATALIQHVRGYSEPMWHAIGGRLEAVLLLGGATTAAAVVAEWSDIGARYRLNWS